MNLYRNWGKRFLDVTATASSLILWAPLLGLIALLLKLSIGKPIHFCQKRPGLRGKSFRLFKFRTMSDARDDNGELLSDEKRITRIGRLLRATSLDEIPTLWNVLRGDMSLVGPRPLLMQYLQRYSPEQARRHEVRSGITGWAQVHGRNVLTWEEKFKLDVWYVDHCSLWLDLKILWLTLIEVVKREGISARGHATMPEFLGKESSTHE